MNVKQATLKLTVLANLSALSIIGRIALSSIGGFQPVTFIIILTALFIDLKSAFLIAIVSTIITNLFLGWGVWVFYQIFTWCVIALLTMLIARFKEKIVVVSIWGFISGFVYGFFISLWSYHFFGAKAGFLVYWIAGLRHDFSHAMGNLIFCWALYPIFRYFIKKLNFSNH